MVSEGMPPPVERRGHISGSASSRRYGVSSLPPSMLVLHSSAQVPSKGCFQYALPPTSALARRPASVTMSHDPSAVARASHSHSRSTGSLLVGGGGAVAALKPRRRERPMTQFLTVAQRKSMEWNGLPTTRHLKVRSIPAHSQSVQAYNNLQRRSSGSHTDVALSSTAVNGGGQSPGRNQVAGGQALAGDTLQGPDEFSRTSSRASPNGGGSIHSVSSGGGAETSAAAVSSVDGRPRVPGTSRSRDDSFSRRRPSTGTSSAARMSTSEASEYTLSPDMEQKVREKLVSEVCRRYGGNLRTQRAARTIQLAFREHMLKKRLELHVKTRSRLFSNPPTMEQLRLSGLPASPSHRFLSESKSAHRPLKRVRVSPAPSSHSVASSIGESMDSIVGVSEMVVVMPEAGDLSTDVSLAGDAGTSSETSSVNYSMSPQPNGDSMKTDSMARNGTVSPASDVSTASPSPGIDAGGQFEVMRRASFAVKPSDSKLRRQRQLRIGITHFNRRPSKGIQYLISKGLLHDDSRSVAMFLKKQGGLSRSMIGEYLGNLQSGFNQSVLEEFVGIFNLQSESFVGSLRKFLATFRIPGEAQKIERILQVFAERYAECNDDDLKDDVIFVLAFSTIMLNTDLHNRSVKQSMTKDQFVHNNRGINGGEDLPRELLESIYNEVFEREFKTLKDHVQQVASLEKSISGQFSRLAQPHRQLVHVARMAEVVDKEKKQTASQHLRFLFLFNDMLLVAKYAPKKSGWNYVFKSSLSLLGMKVETFSNVYFKFGIQISTIAGGKVMMMFNGEKTDTTRNFFRDMQEVMSEIIEMEAERIQDMERVAQRSKSADLSPEVTRRGHTLAPGCTAVASSMPARGSPLTQQPTLVPIVESASLKRSSFDTASLQRPLGSSADRRSLSSSDLKPEDDPRESPTPSQGSESSGERAERDGKEHNGSITSVSSSTSTATSGGSGVRNWTSKIYSGKKRKSQPTGHLP